MKKGINEDTFRAFQVSNLGRKPELEVNLIKTIEKSNLFQI